MTEHQDQTPQPGNAEEQELMVTAGDAPAGRAGHEPAYAVSRRRFLRTAGGAAAVGVAAAGAITWMATRGFGPEPPVEPVSELVAGFHDGPLPDDPIDDVWTRRPPVVVAMLAQQMATPMLAEAVLEEMRLRALHNGDEIAFHVEWDDDEIDDLDAMARFRDSLAVQLPVRPDVSTPITMGGPEMPVHILHWKASWQRQLEHGERRIRDAFPYAVNEVTPEDMMGEEAARVFYPALYVGNLAAERNRTTCVEELVAEGFGTLTTQELQRAQGTGVHADGRWQVVIRAPLAGDETHATVRPGTPTQVALACWDGGHDNRGARKHWSNWLAMDVEGVA